MSPGVADVAGGTEDGFGRGPGELVDFGIPIGGLDDGDAADCWLLTIAEGDTVFSEPVSKRSTTAGEDVFGESCFEVEEEDFSGIDGGVA